MRIPGSSMGSGKLSTGIVISGSGNGWGAGYNSGIIPVDSGMLPVGILSSSSSSEDDSFWWYSSLDFSCFLEWLFLCSSFYLARNPLPIDFPSLCSINRVSNGSLCWS